MLVAYDIRLDGRKYERLQGLFFDSHLSTDFSKKFLRLEDLLWRA